MQMYNWMSQWSLGLYLLAKPSTWMCLVFLTSNVFLFSLMQGRELHGNSNNINCVIQCVTNPLDQSIQSILEQNKSCQTAKVQLQKTLRNCIQDNRELNDTYTIQSSLLDDTNKKQKITHKELEQLSKEIKKERQDLLRLNLSCITAKQQLKEHLASCEENYTVISYSLQSETKQLESVTKQLAVFTNHSQLLESVYNQVEQMETCRIKLKEYCEFKNKDESLTKFEKGTMKRFENYIGCKERLSKNYYGRILSSYAIKLDKLLEVQEKLVHLLIKGDVKEMEKAQEKEKYLPSNNCQFMCELEEQEEATKTYFEKVKDATWSILQKAFK